MPDCLTKEERDRKLVQIAHSYTDLTEADIQILLDVSHALPSIGNLESGDTYINTVSYTHLQIFRDEEQGDYSRGRKRCRRKTGRFF